MIVRYDPFTAAMAGISAVGSIAGGLSQSNQANDQGIYQRDYYNNQAEHEKIGLNRDLDAAARERNSILSRSRAIMAGNGGGADTDYLAATEGLFAANEFSLVADSEARQSILRTKAGMAMKAGQQAADQALIKGFTNAIPGASALYKEAKTL